MSMSAINFDEFEQQDQDQVFTKTTKQIEACNILNKYEHSMLFGGSRSGKTAIIIRNIFLRATKLPSRHLIVRFRFNHAKTSLWYDTIPKVLRLAFPGMQHTMNKSDWFITVPTARGGESQIWLGGIDDKDRVEKILGNEYQITPTARLTDELMLFLFKGCFFFL